MQRYIKFRGFIIFATEINVSDDAQVGVTAHVYHQPRSEKKRDAPMTCPRGRKAKLVQMMVCISLVSRQILIRVKVRAFSFLFC